MVQHYIDELLELVRNRKVILNDIITHTLPLEQAVQAYVMFLKKQDNCLKVILKPGKIRDLQKLANTLHTETWNDSLIIYLLGSCLALEELFLALEGNAKIGKERLNGRGTNSEL